MLNKFIKPQRINRYAIILPALLITGLSIFVVAWRFYSNRTPAFSSRVSENPAQKTATANNIPAQPSINPQQPTATPTPPATPREYPPQALTYNVTNPPPFKPNPRLQKIVDNAVITIKQQGLPLGNLSISLINLNGNDCCEYASYQDQQPRFPASVSKLFWLVAYYAQVEHGIVPEDVIPAKEVYKMAHKSDNEAASRMVDSLTDAESGANMNAEALGIWEAKRKWLNHFFEATGYQNLNVSQKNFPVPFLQLQRPEGRDLQIRGDGSVPIRNSMTTYDAARLLYEIATEQAVSIPASQNMKELLRQDLAPEVWKDEEYNCVEGFLGESLPADTYFISKVGWTSGSRQETALIMSPDGSVKYILVVFGDDKAYADDWKIFPRVSSLVMSQMLMK
jgi:hypothetical protein